MKCHIENVELKLYLQCNYFQRAVGYILFDEFFAWKNNPVIR